MELDDFPPIGDMLYRGNGYGTVTTEDRGYVPVIEEIAPGLAEQARAIAVQGEDWISAISRAVGTVAMTDYQRRLLNVQLERARNGLPPLQASEYGATVNVGVAPSTQALLLYAGAALVLVALLRRRS